MYVKSNLLMCLVLVFGACSPNPAFIRAPFEGVTNNVAEKELDVSEGGVLAIGNGTEIHVPADAFVDTEGNPVTGKVKLSYTDLSDPASMIISGIPLNFGIKENPSVMESAGMFDLSATANGNELELASGKSIRTVISSNAEGDKYDFFQLNAEGKTWDKLGEVQPTINPAIDELNTSLAEKNNASETFDMEYCFAFNYAYDLDIYLDEDKDKLKDKRFNYYTWDTAPATKTLEKVLKTKLAAYGISSMLKERVWEEVSWGGQMYNPNLLVWKSERAIPNWIVNSKEYHWTKLKKQRGDRYKLQFLRHLYKDNVWKEVVDFTTYVTPKIALEELYSGTAEARSEEYDILLSQMEKEKEILAAQNKVLREFNISKMGVYNYDYIKEEERLLVQAELYVDGVKSEGQLTDLFVVVKGENAVLRYSASELERFVIYPEQELFAFMVAEGNAIVMQQENALADIDFNSFGKSPDQKLRIDLQSTDYVINEPIDLTIFLDKEVNEAYTEVIVSMR